MYSVLSDPSAPSLIKVGHYYFNILFLRCDFFHFGLHVCQFLFFGDLVWNSYEEEKYNFGEKIK